MRLRSWVGLVLRVGVALGLTVAAAACGRGADQASNPNARVPAGFHEFELFGSNSTYLSHYPMFGSIHAYQVLLKATLTSTRGGDFKRAYIARKQKSPDAGYSVSSADAHGVNQYWVMPDKIKEGKTFTAVVRWWKDDVNSSILAHVTVRIDKVIHFRLFQPNDSRPAVLQYLLFGNRSEAFLAHWISRYPDFDQVVQVHLDKASARPNDGKATVVTFAGRKNKETRRVSPPEVVVGRVKGAAVRIQVENEIHLEPELELQG